MTKYSKVFKKHAAERFPLSRPWDHTIKFKKEFKQENTLKNKQWGRIYPLSLIEKEELHKFIDENLAKGFIRRSDSQFAFPFFFMSKKDRSLRPVQDYPALNEVTIKNAYPLPLIDNLFNQLTNATIFTKFDVCAGYNNICIKEGNQHKAAFITPLGLFEPIVMFFGLCNALATFQDMMDTVFKDLVCKGWLIIYMDDMLIFSDNIKEHRIQTCQVLQQLQEHDLYLKPEKCKFEVSEVEFLGAIIHTGEIAIDPIKLKAIQEWPAPQTVKQVQMFLGFGNFY